MIDVLYHTSFNSSPCTSESWNGIACLNLQVSPYLQLPWAKKRQKDVEASVWSGWIFCGAGGIAGGYSRLKEGEKVGASARKLEASASAATSCSNLQAFPRAQLPLAKNRHGAITGSW